MKGKSGGDFLKTPLIHEGPLLFIFLPLINLHESEPQTGFIKNYM